MEDEHVGEEAGHGEVHQDKNDEPDEPEPAENFLEPLHFKVDRLDEEYEEAVVQDGVDQEDNNEDPNGAEGE